MPTVSARASADRTLSVLAGLGAVAIVLFLLTPRASPATLALLALTIGLAGGLVSPWLPLRRLPVPAALMLALAAWAALSVIWSADRGETFNKSVLLIALAGTACWAQLAVKETRHELLRHAGNAALLAFGATLAFLCFEELTGHILKRTLFYLVPFTRPDGKHIADAENAMMVSGYISNRSMATLMLALWPMLLLGQAVVERSRRLAVAGALVVLTVVTTLFSKHETSIIAVALSAMVFVACVSWPKLGLCMVAAGWVVATMLVVPVASWALHGAHLQDASWLPNSARHRIVLWAYTAEQVRQRPITGIGAAATKTLDIKRGPDYEKYAGTRYEWRAGPHAHNIYLQTWYELGAVGAALLCAAGLALVAVLSRLPARAMPHATAAMTAAAVTGAFSWGLWQAWFLAAFAVSAVLTAVGVQLMRSEEAAASQGG